MFSRRFLILRGYFLLVTVGSFTVLPFTVLLLNISDNLRYEVDDLNGKPRICCLILTSPKTFLTRARAVNNTWGPRCDRYYFITEFSNQTLLPTEFQAGSHLPIAPIKNIPVGYNHLTRKSSLALLFASEKHLNEFDWFIKADDDTYLLVENLKSFLREQNASEPITFGYNFKVMKRDKSILVYQLYLLDNCSSRVSFRWSIVCSQS